MIYHGKVQNGTVVFEGNRRPPEGTDVLIESVRSPDKPPRGSYEAIRESIGIWAGCDDEIDRLLAELKEMKQAEVERQLREPEPEL